MTIKTVPPVSGARLTFDLQQLTAGSAGVATFTAQHDFLPHVLTVMDTSAQQGGLRYRFSRWAGQRDPSQAFTPRLAGLPLRANYTITAAFSVQYPVTPVLVDGNSHPVPLDQVSRLTIKSDSGAVAAMATTTPTWLDGQRPIYHHSELTAERVTYSLQSVMVRGTNVVDSGRQTFQPAAGGTAKFTTQFHDLTITAHDALFHSATGTEAIVTFPDGGKATLRLDAQHSTTMRNLPRGKYTVVVKAGRAIVAANEFTLSKDKTTDVAVISVWDLVLLALSAAVIALALIAIGRTHLRHRLIPSAIRRRRRRRRDEDMRLPAIEDTLT